MHISTAERIKAFFEAWHPYMAAAVVWALSTKTPITIPTDFLTGFIGTAATMAAVFMGFMATSMSILILYRGTRISEELRSKKVMNNLVRYLREAMAWILGWLISCFALYFQQTPTLLSAWLTLATLALLCFLRIAVLLSRLIKDEG